MDVPVKAPDFTLPDENGKSFHLAAVIGKHKLVVFFYPKNETPTCTKEACAFRDNFELFAAAGAMVIGISSDSVQSHHAFRQHHNLPYRLLSDGDGGVARAFGVKKKFFLIPGRETFVIDLTGNIVFHHAGMLNGAAHVAEALRFITG